MLPLSTQPVVIVRAVLAAGYGGSLSYDWDAASRTTVAGVVQPAGGAERVKGRDHVTARARCFLPAGTDVLATDRVEAAGVLYDVDGPPQAWDGPTGQPHHVELLLKRDEGG